MTQSQAGLVEADEAAGEPYDFPDDARAERLDGSDLESMARSAMSGKGGSKSEKTATAEADPQFATDDDFNPQSTLRHDSPPENDVDDFEKLIAETEENADKPAEKPADKPENEGPEIARWDSSLGSQLKTEFEELGLGHLAEKYDSPKEAVRGVVEAARLVGQRNDEAANWQSLLEDEAFQRDVYERLGQKFGAPQGPAAADASATPAGAAAGKTVAEEPKGAPKFDPRWWAYIADGKIKPGAPSDVVADIDKYRAEKRKYDEDPAAYMQPWIQQQIKQGISDAIKPLTETQKKAEDARKQEEQQRFATEQLHARGEQALSRYANYIFSYDDKGQPVMANGKMVLTQAGTTFNDKLQEAKSTWQRGTRTLEGFDLTDPEGRVEWAWKHTLEHYRKNPPKNAAPKKQDKRLDRPAGGNIRGGGKVDDSLFEGVSLDADGLETALNRAMGKGQR